MRLGVLDIGSNTVHLLLVDAQPGARPTAYADHKQPLSLIQHLDSAGRIRESGVQRLIDFINSSVKFARDNGAEDMIAFTTSAIRESANGPEVLEKVVSETGVHLSELTGNQEAAMTYFAVRRWHGWHVEHLLNFDIGGGSFEISYGVDELPTEAVSVQLGASRLTREFLLDDPPKPKHVKKLRKHIRELLLDTYQRFPAIPDDVVVTGTSKTFRSLARIAGSAPSSDGPFVRRSLKLADLRYWNKIMAGMSSTERLKLPGVSDLRARQVLAGGLVAEEAMRIFAVKKLQICPWALREGLIMGRLDALLMDGIVGKINGDDGWVSGVELGTEGEKPGMSVGVDGV